MMVKIILLLVVKGGISMVITTIDYVRHRINKLSENLENRSTEEIRKSLSEINQDLLDISYELYERSMNVQHYTGLKQEEYNKWFNDVRTKEYMEE